MIKPSVNLQELRRRIYRKAKAEKSRRFWGFYVHVSKVETLRARIKRPRPTTERQESMERVFSPSKPKG
jgi:hypothetical protein